jgi:phage gp29-like protein
MTTPIYIRSPNSRAYAYALAAAWNVGTWLPDPDWALAQDADVWEKFQRDPVIAHAMAQRLHSVTAVDPSVQPGGKDDASKRAADWFEDWLGQISNLTQARYQTAKSIFVARTYGYVGGERKEAEIGGVRDRWWVSSHIEDADRRRFQFVPVKTRMEGEIQRTKYSVDVQMWSNDSHDWITIPSEHMRRFIVFTYDDEEARLGYGRGLMAALYLPFFAKTTIQREGLDGLQRWAKGIPVVTMKSRVGSTDKTNAAQRQKWLDTILKMNASGGIVMEEGDTLDLKFPSGEGANAALAWIESLNREMTQAILGSVLPTGGGADVGSNARAETEAESSQILIQYDRKILDEAYSRTLVDLAYTMNRPQLERAGIWGAKRPKLVSVHESRMDPKGFADMAKVISDTGVPIKLDEYYERTGLTMPGPMDAIVERPAQPDPFGAMAGAAGAFPSGGAKPLPSEMPSPLDAARARVAETLAGENGTADGESLPQA